MQAKTFNSLSPSGNRSLVADDIFRNCGAHKLCDDGHHLVDGGINEHRRLWLTYQFDSLTDYDDRQKYTSLVALISVVANEQCGSELFFGFDWKRPETLSRLIFDKTEATLMETVFADESWHSVHRLAYRPTVG